MKRLFTFAPVFLCGLAGLQSATLERLSLEEMIARSTSIVQGKVTGSWAAFSGPVIYTHYTVQVSQRLKGAGSDSMEIVVPGGVANNLRQTFAGAPELKAGNEYVLMLWTGKEARLRSSDLPRVSSQFQRIPERTPWRRARPLANQ